MQHARDRIRELTGRPRLLLPAELIVEDLNRFLRGWAAYFRYGNSARAFGKIRNYARMRLALWLSKKGNRRHAWGWGINGAAVPGPPRPDHPGWNRRRTQALPGLAGKSRMPPVNDVGKPCAGEPHARFDGRGLETEPQPAAPRQSPTLLDRDVHGLRACRW